MDTTQIREHMEVIGSDGEHVGTVDHMDGDDKIKLAKKDPAAGGEHHWVNVSDVDHIDEHVHLKITGSEVNQAV